MDKLSTGDYKLTQVFGDKSSADKVAEEDIISCVKFDKNGKYLSLGDKAGRLIIFDLQQVKGKKHGEFTYYTELQSHVKEFDPLRSIETQERINEISWMRPQGKNLYVMTTNNKTIKLWKLSHKLMKKVVKSAGKELAMPKLQVVEDGLVPTLLYFVPNPRKTFPSLHTSNINSVSNSNNEEYVLSSDDFKIYLWNVEEPNKAFVPIEIKPENPDEPSEVITSSIFHPTSDSLFAYGTSKGVLRMADLRVSAVCDNTAVNFLHESSAPKNFFSEIIAGYSGLTFTKNEKYLAARDFLNVKVWDLAMAHKPVSVVPINESLKSKLCDMYENQQIFERFSLSANCDSKHFLTGDFNSSFHVVDIEGNNSQYEVNFNRRTVCKQITSKIESLGQMDYTRKTLRTSFHPTQNTAVTACLNCFFIYNI